MAGSIPQQIGALRRRIEKHNHKYYVEAAPEISDREFDHLIRRLQILEQQHPQLITPDSPTQRVGGRPIAGFRSVHHRVPMLSIDNTYNEADLRNFDVRIRRGLQGVKPQYSVEQKIDGASVTLLYKNGQLQLAATHGDGLRGDDITHNVRTIRDIPFRLQTSPHRPPKVLEIRGEVYLTNAELTRLNALQQKQGERVFANTRNAAAGSLKLHDPRICAKRRLRFFAHSEGQLEGLRMRTHGEFMELIRRFGIPLVPHSELFDSIDAVQAYADEQLDARHTFDYEMDGLVVKVDDFSQRERLGVTSKSPRWAIAYKVELWQASTRIEAIHVQVGKSGVLTPVATLEPVEIAGSTISRVSLFNADEIHRKDIHIGDTVVVEKAGKVIPHVVRVELDKRRGHVRPYRFPTKCPVCRQRVVRDAESVYIRCQNRSCPGQLKERLRFFAHRQAMNIEGLGPALIDQLVDHGLVRSVADVYRLRLDQLLELERTGKKSAQKLLEQIAASKERGLARVLAGLGIRHVGDRNARLLADEFGTITALRTASTDRLARVGVGRVVAHSVHDFFESESGRKLVQELLDLGVKMSKERGQESGHEALAGKTVVVTGTLATFTRDEAEQVIHQLGGHATSSVSHKTDFVIVGKEPGTKLDRARTLGIKTIGEREFLRLAGRKGSHGKA